MADERDNIVEFPTKAEELLVGPFSENRVVVEGRCIPHLTGWREGGETFLCVDHRFAVAVPSEIASSVAWLIAHAMAVAQGYPSLNAESKSMPFAPKISRMDEVPRG